MSNAPSVWSPISTILLLLVLSIQSWRRRNLPGALPFMAGCLFTILTLIGQALAVTSARTETRLFWLFFEFAWILPATTAITCFVLEYAWPGRWLTRRSLVLISILPLLFSVYCLAEGIYILGGQSFFPGGTNLDPFSPANLLIIGYTSVMTLVNLSLFAWLFVRSPQHRWPVLIMTCTAVYLTTIILRTPLDQDTQVFNFPWLAWPLLAYAVALFGFHTIDPVALARQTAVDQLYAGMIVLDQQGQIVSLNPAAERIMGIRTRQARGQTILVWLPDYPDLKGTDGSEVEISLGDGAERGDYMLAVSPLKDFRGLQVGELLVLHNISAQKQAQAQILEQQSALAALQERAHLARDLHDDLAQTLAFLNVQAQASHELLVAQKTDLADERLLRLAAVARQAHTQVRAMITDLRSPIPAQDDFIQHLKDYLNEFGAAHDLQVEFHFPHSAILPESFTPYKQAQLFHIVQEALTNIGKHARATHVCIQLAVQEDQVRAEIEDDGVGFIPGALAGEKKHLGLRIMQERSEQAAGRLEIQSTPGQGTRVIVKMPGVGG